MSYSSAYSAMTATEIIERYEVPREYHEAVFLAYEKGAEDYMVRLSAKKSEQMRALGKKGGQSTKQKHGPDYYGNIAKMK